MDKEGFVSKVHGKEPHLKSMPRQIQPSNAGELVIRSSSEHVFADQKPQMGLFVRTVGIIRATLRIGPRPQLLAQILTAKVAGNLPLYR